MQLSERGSLEPSLNGSCSHCSDGQCLVQRYINNMKKLIIGLSVALLVAGCTSLYTNIVTITSVVDKASKEYAHEYNLGHVPANVAAEVSKSHQQYRNAAAVAQGALITYKATGNEASYVSALEATRAAAGGLIDLIVPYLVKSDSKALKTNLAKASKL